MANNLPEDLKHDWVDNEIVMPADVNAWSSATNTIKDVIPLYATAGNFYTATYTSNTYNLTPITVDGKTNVPPTAYIDGMSIVFKCPTDNQANCKVKIGSLTAKSIYSLENVNLPAGKLKQGCYIELKFDSLNDCFKFQQDLNKADVGEVVDLTSNQIIEGVKEFTEIIQGTVDKSIKDSDGNDISQTYVKNTDNKFHALKGYSDKGELLEDTEGLADVIEYAHSTFDNTKFTAGGTPTITNEGVVSGFTANDYVNIPNIDVTNYNTWKMHIPVKLTTDTGTLGFFSIGGSGMKTGIVYQASNTLQKLTFYVYTGASTVISGYLNQTLHLNTEYILVVGYNGTEFFMKVLDSNYQVLNTVNIESAVNIYSGGDIRIGLRQTATPFTGGICDLKKVKIIGDGVEVFNGNKTGIDTIKPDNYTVVGTPTITADGVAGDFSVNDYITTSGFTLSDLQGKSWAFEGCILYKVGVTQHAFVRFSESWEAWGSIRVTSNTITLALKTGTTEESSEEGNKITIAPTFTEDTYCKCKVEYNHNTGVYTLSIGKLGEDYTQSGTWTATTTNTELLVINNNPTNHFMIGKTSNSSAFEDEIDLNSIKLYIENDLVYQCCLKIPYTESITGSKITNVDYLYRLTDMFNQFGYSPYYSIQEIIVPKYSVIGSPTIDSNYVASNFDQNNYLSIRNYATLDKNTYFSINVFFTTPSAWGSSGGRFWSHGQSNYVGHTRVGKLSGQFLGISIINSNLDALDTNTEYEASFIYDEIGFYVKYKKKNENTWTISSPASITSDTSIQLSTQTIGKENSGTAPFLGSIDLKHFSINIEHLKSFNALQMPCFTLPQGEIYGIIEKNNREIGVPISTFSNVLKDDEIWLEGASVLKTDYPRLYAIYGDVYEDSNNPTDSNHFRLPNCTDRVMQGINSTGTFGYIAPGLPNITGNMEVIGDHPYVGADGSFYIQNVGMGGNPIDTTPDGSSDWRISFNASRSSWIYGNSNTVQAPAIKVRVKTRYK